MSVFSSNAGKYVPEKTPYSDTFHAVIDAINLILILFLQTCYDALNSRIYWLIARWPFLTSVREI